MTNFIVAPATESLLCTRCDFRGDEGIAFRQSCDCGGERYVAPSDCIVIKEEDPFDLYKFVKNIMRDLQCEAE